MKTGKRTTYIFLERDSEDVALLRELKNLVAAGGVSGMEFIKTFPLVHELIWNLKNETSGDAI